MICYLWSADRLLSNTDGVSSESAWWKGQLVIHSSFSSLLALVWSIQLVRTIHAERETVNLQAGEETGYLSSFVNPFQYEEGRWAVEGGELLLTS